MASRHSKPFRLSKGPGGVQGRAGRARMISRGGNMVEVMMLQARSAHSGGDPDRPIALRAAFLFGSTVHVIFDRAVVVDRFAAHWRYFHTDDNKLKIIRNDTHVIDGGFTVVLTFIGDEFPELLGPPHVEYTPGPNAPGLFPMVDVLHGRMVRPFSIPAVGAE